VVRRRKVRLGDAGRGGSRSDRLVDPWGLVDKADIWYLIAGTVKGQRTFRVDRIVEAVVTQEPAQRPADFELAQAWQEVVDHVEVQRSPVSATVSVPERFVRVLRGQFGRHCEVLATHEGRATVRLAAPTPLMIAQHLAGWGALLEVVESEPVQAELARLGSELVTRYAGALPGAGSPDFGATGVAVPRATSPAGAAAGVDDASRPTT
jgi:predicted DNA-binding transcriptional regulator YafY